MIRRLRRWLRGSFEALWLERELEHALVEVGALHLENKRLRDENARLRRGAPS